MPGESLQTEIGILRDEVARLNLLVGAMVDGASDGDGRDNGHGPARITPPQAARLLGMSVKGLRAKARRAHEDAVARGDELVFYVDDVKCWWNVEGDRPRFRVRRRDCE